MSGQGNGRVVGVSIGRERQPDAVCERGFLGGDNTQLRGHFGLRWKQHHERRQRLAARGTKRGRGDAVLAHRMLFSVYRGRGRRHGVRQRHGRNGRGPQRPHQRVHSRLDAVRRHVR